MEVKDLQSQSDQQALMALLPELLKRADKEMNPSPLHYMRTTQSDSGANPIQRLTKRKNKEFQKILELNNIEIASLVPKIQLWKVYVNDNQEITKEIYIPYSQDSRDFVQSIFANKQTRGDDVGIQNVTFQYDGQDVATAETLLGCSVEFVFGNAESLVKDRGDGFRYAELFFFENTKSTEVIDRDQYDIFLKVGYELDGSTETLSSDVKDALRSQESMFRLSMTGYDLDFKPNGMVIATVQYASANIKYFADNRNEIFGFKQAAFDEAPTTLEQLSEFENQANVSLEELSESIDRPVENFVDNISLFNRIQTYMSENGMLKKQRVVAASFDGTFDNATEQLSQGSFGGKNDFSEDLTAETAKDISVDGALQGCRETREIPYFYFGDLLEAVLATNKDIFERMKSRKFAFVLDNVGHQFTIGDEIRIFNAAKTPISQRSYDEWFQKTIIMKDKKVTSLMFFVRSLIDNFLSSILRTREGSQSGSDYVAELVSNIAQVPGGVSDNRGISGTTDLPIKPVSFFSKDSSSYYEYFVVYDDKYYKDRLSADAEEFTDADRYKSNIENGIPHFYIGSDRGLLKEFNFQKADMGEDIAIIKNLESSNPLQQLWTIFNVSLSLVGNDLLRVGKNIYLDPTVTGLGSPFKTGTVSNLMGLGGYYMVQKVAHSYYPTWVTNVEATVIIPASQQKAYTTGAGFTYY